MDAGSPWAFGLGLYFWLPAVDADLSSGTNDASIDASVLELFESTEGILTLGGHFEGWWNRIGLYINGGYFYLDFEDQETKGGDAGVLTEIGLLEYSAMFRITGARAGEEVAGWAEKSGPPRVDLHAGGLTTWLRNDIDPEGTPGASNDVVLTSPLLGARATVDISPRWVFHLEGSVGGFGVDDVEFAGEGLATFGYRTKLFGAPMALSLGYKVLCLDVDSQRGEERVKSDFLFHGPLIDLTFSW